MLTICCDKTKSRREWHVSIKMKMLILSIGATCSLVFNSTTNMDLKIKGLSKNAHLNLLYDFTYVYSSFVWYFPKKKHSLSVCGALWGRSFVSAFFIKNSHINHKSSIECYFKFSILTFYIWKRKGKSKNDELFYIAMDFIFLLLCIYRMDLGMLFRFDEGIL